MRRFEGFQKGVDLGGWISQFARYDHDHFKTFITKDDIAYIASLGFDHVRVPVDYNVLEDEEGKRLDSGFEYLRSCLSWCREYDLRMIIDLHECYGYSFDPLKVDMDRRKFFYDQALQERFLKLWKEIAIEFKEDTDVVAFEPLNEVVLAEVYEAWNQVVRKYIEMMRTIVPTAWLIIGGIQYNSIMAVKLLDPPCDDHIVYNFHCYEPLIFTHQGAYWTANMPLDYRIDYPESLEYYRSETERLGVMAGALVMDNISQIGPEFFENVFEEAIDVAEKYNAPLYCGEYGVIDLAENRAKLRWLKDIHSVFEKYGIGHALWNYKEKDFGLVDERFEEIKEEFIHII